MKMKRPFILACPNEAIVYSCLPRRSEHVDAFVPHPLPPSGPPLQLEGELNTLLNTADEKLRLLDLAGDLVPSVTWFVYAFVRKEAVLSAQIEGTQTTLMDLLEVEASEHAPRDADVAEVCAYIDALDYSWDELGHEAGLPISVRLLSETHRRLLSGARGEHKQPGEPRRAQNWIGGTRPGNAKFVPPPPHRLDELLAEFEQAIHDESDLPPLVRVGLLHVQFETLHPYLDGNGRLGRLLITLLMRHWGLLSRPLLYLSLYLKANREEYFSLLNSVRTNGDWERWLAFFLEGVAVVAEEAVATSRSLYAISEESRARLHAHEDATVLSLRLFELIPQHPILTVTRATSLVECSRPAAAKALRVLESAEVLYPLDDRKVNRTLVFEDYLAVLRKGTELMP